MFTSLTYPGYCQRMDQSIAEVAGLVERASTSNALRFEEFMGQLLALEPLGAGADMTPKDALTGAVSGPPADLLAAILLELLDRNRALVEASELRRHVMAFLIEGFGRKLGPYYAPPRRPQAHEELARLGAVVAQMHRKAHEILEGLTSSDRLPAVRQQLMKHVNGSAGRVVFRPLLPPAATEKLLGPLFEAAVAIEQATDREAVRRSHRAFRELAAEVEKHIAHWRFRATAIVIKDTITALERCTSRTIELASPPAKLRFTASSRPLPLLEVGVTCRLRVTVENIGEAPANDLTITAEATDNTLAPDADPVHLGRLDPNTRKEFAVSLLTLAATDRTELALTARWSDPDHSLSSLTPRLSVVAHPAHIDWTEAESAEPYAPYPVETRDHLVGREATLAQLVGRYTARPLANLYVTGQRRVGKTSLVRVAVAELREQPKTLIALVEMGEVRAGTPEATIAALGERLAKGVISAAGLEEDIPIPDFRDSLAPLTDVVDSVCQWDNFNVLFVIDEFDELPHHAYRKDGPGDALFVPMRSLAQRPNVGWLLVGGERMPFIRDEQASRLNTFHEVSLDYLPRTTVDGPDFSDLVRRPLPEGFHVADDAVDAIYRESAGNPHFAKELCASVYRRCVMRRDAVITGAEIEACLDDAVREKDVELFAHFWEDGIFETGDMKRRRELQRRSFLLACARVLREHGLLNHLRIEAAASDEGLEPVDVQRLKAEVVRRKIMSDEDGTLNVVVPMFQRWLETEGIYKLPPKGVSEEVGSELRARSARAEVKAREIGRLVRRWGDFRFRGQRVTRDEIAAWLRQFDDALERRAMFRLLERVHALSEAEIYEGLRRLNRLVAKPAHMKLDRGQRLLKHLFVAPLGEGGSSGDAIAYQFRQANRIDGRNVVQRHQLIDRLQRSEVTAVVLIDDLVGSGGTAIKALREIAERAGELSNRSPVHWYVFAVAGVPSGADAISHSSAGRELGVQVEFARVLPESELPLSSQSTVFDDEDAAFVRATLEKYAKQHNMSMPLGYRDACVPIVLPDNCPNNAPAVLWSDAGDWEPLFPRTPKR